MDGNFVPNMALGLEDVKAVRQLTDKPIDIHLMVQNPNNFIKMFANLNVNIIYIHYEADQLPSKTLQIIRNLGIHPGLAINPGTSLDNIKDLLPLVDYILVMTVNPGFSGQSFLDYTINKIKDFVNYQSKCHYQIMVDGAISEERIEQLSLLGVNGFIVGTSSVFGKKEDYRTIIHRIKGVNND